MSSSSLDVPDLGCVRMTAQGLSIVALRERSVQVQTHGTQVLLSLVDTDSSSSVWQLSPPQAVHLAALLQAAAEQVVQ